MIRNLLSVIGAAATIVVLFFLGGAILPIMNSVMMGLMGSAIIYPDLWVTTSVYLINIIVPNISYLYVGALVLFTLALGIYFAR